MSIGGESNSDRISPPRLTRSFIPSASPTEERRRTLISDAAPRLVKNISPEPEIKEKTAISGFPTAKKDNLPALPVAKNRPIKTSVSNFFHHQYRLFQLKIPILSSSLLGLNSAIGWRSS